MTIQPMQPQRALRIGVDCGGTNTDAVVLDLTPGATEVIVDSVKSPTTPDVTTGVRKAISILLARNAESIVGGDIQAVSIGTTHFVNALITRSSKDLDRVAVIRLCGPYTRRTKPFSTFPFVLRDVMEGPHFLVDGGIQIDGNLIANVNESEIEAACAEIKAQGIRCVAITGVFSPIDFDFKQEELVASIIKRILPGVSISCSMKVANLGLLARENATILNCSLLRFASKTIKAFRLAMTELGLSCPVFVTSNDGCLMSLSEAAQFPIRTFSSGPTNSMRGASFLAHLHEPSGKAESALVVDIGGTTTDIGILLPSGFPRQAASQHKFCDVMMNFSMPHVTSIGVGGGSLITHSMDENVDVGPESVGYRLGNEALVFGGSTLTATDICVAAGKASDIGTPGMVQNISKRLIGNVEKRIKAMLEVTIDSMKTSPQDTPVYLVGGGAILCPPELSGVSKVHRFPHYQCANAVGAAVAQVARSIDTVKRLGDTSIAEMQRRVEREAVDLTIGGGARPDTVQIVESEAIPVAYVTDRCRFVVRAAGEWEPSADDSVDDEEALGNDIYNEDSKNSATAVSHNGVDHDWTTKEILEYRPRMEAGIWHLSELDIEFISIGCYILGCGGGGDPMQSSYALKDMIRSGVRLRVRSLASIHDDSLIGWGGNLGSPDVGKERLIGDEYLNATKELWEYLKTDRKSVAGLSAVEIGGGNGLVNMVIGASSELDIPVIDGDFQGRAYPTSWQCTAVVFDDNDRGQALLPAAVSSGNGTSFVLRQAKHYKLVDSILRAACVEVGSRVGVAHRPLSAAFCKKAMVANTISLSWRIGKAVELASKGGNLDRVGEEVIKAQGEGTGKVLFVGKVINVTRGLRKGHSYGEVTIAPLPQGDQTLTSSVKYEGTVTIPFKNENLLVRHTGLGGPQKLLASVPDLIAVLDQGSGRNIGTQDYKYGQRVIVIGLTAASQWTATKRGLEIGALGAFDLEGEYEAIGTYKVARSVLEEYGE